MPAEKMHVSAAKTCHNTCWLMKMQLGGLSERSFTTTMGYCAFEMQIIVIHSEACHQPLV